MLSRGLVFVFAGADGAFWAEGGDAREASPDQQAITIWENAACAEPRPH